MADLKVVVRDREGAEVGSMAIPAAALGDHVRPALIHRAVVRYGNNKRAGTASTKTRSEISRSNRKPWPQKGTGRARAGTRRSPLWVGGGVIFGPHPRRYRTDLNRRQRRLAVRSAILGKLRDGEVIVVDALDLEEPRTKLMARQLARLGIAESCLIGLASVPRNVLLACRNLPGVKVVPVREFTAYDVMRRRTILMTRGALELLLAGDGGAEAAAAPAEEEKEIQG